MLHRKIPGLALILILAGCAAPAPSGSLATAAAASARPTPEPSVPEAPPPVPPINPLLNTSDRTSRGAWAMVLVGAFGQVEANGQGLCHWAYDTGQPVFQLLHADPISLFGERVSVRADPFLAQLWRLQPAPAAEEAHVRYAAVVGSQSMDAITVGDVSWLRFWNLGADALSLPPDQMPNNWFGTLGGRADTERVSGAVSWRCLTAPPEPGPVATPIPQPTPRCPSGLGPGEFPALPAAALSGVRGDTEVGPVVGLIGSMIWSTCDTQAGDGTPWLIPNDALDARQMDLLVMDLTNDFAVVSWRALAVHANDVPNETRSNVIDLGHGIAKPDGAASFAAPPIGDWVIVVHATSINDDGTVVVDSPYYFRVKVSAID